MSSPKISINNRVIGPNHFPLVVAEIGINHEGNIDKAFQMIDDARKTGCECVKFQSHIIEDEMIPNDVVPANSKDTIWNIMKRCAFTEEQEAQLKEYAEKKNMIYLCTPFSRKAANRLQKLNVSAFKIGSGECNNYPLVEHIAQFKKPVILSTGMNNLENIEKSVNILRRYKVQFALLHCTSIYPTPYEKVRLGALSQLKNTFPDAVVGLSDHSLTNYPCLGAVALGASILERHFTSDKNWPGPDISISMDPPELKDLIEGSRAIFKALGGKKEILAEEQPTIDFAYASVVSIKDIIAEEILSEDNIWVKRPGTGEIKAAQYKSLLGKRAKIDIGADSQIKWDWICE